LSLLKELDSIISNGSPDRRLRALWHVTDVLIAGNFTEDQIWTFGEVIERLACEIEVAARSKLAAQLAHSPNAPIQTVNKLAFDDSIVVAGPILQHSDRLDVRALLANAKTKSQEHLLAISRRKSIPESVTDVLVKRGDESVARSVAANGGARFSDFGISTLVKKARNDGGLALCVWSRPDIPRQNLVRLFVEASEALKNQLVEADPRRAAHGHSLR